MSAYGREVECHLYVIGAGRSKTNPVQTHVRLNSWTRHLASDTLNRSSARGGNISEPNDEIWDRWQRGESMSSIGRGFERESSSIYPLLSRTGGIRPPDRKRSRLSLTLVEREEISRGLEGRLSLRCIARHLQRSASTISREVNRNGGTDHYRAIQSDQATWDRAHRPKLCKLACNRALCRTISRKLQLNCKT